MNKKNIVIASDSFKGSLSSIDICNLFKNALEGREDLMRYIFLSLMVEKAQLRQ